MSTRLAVILVAVLVALGFAAGYVLHRPTPVPVAQAVQASRAATVAAAKATIRYRIDTLKATRLLTRYDTARVTDTVTVDSVVYVDRTIADSTVRACRAVLSSCSVALAAKDTVIAAKTREIAAVNAGRPSRLHQLSHDAILIGLSGGAGYVLGRAGFTVSVPVHF